MFLILIFCFFFIVNERNDTQNEGIPESVTADLDELEREGVVTGNMSELSGLFGDLIEDELLGLCSSTSWLPRISNCPINANFYCS